MNQILNLGDKEEIQYEDVKEVYSKKQRFKIEVILIAIAIIMICLSYLIIVNVSEKTDNKYDYSVANNNETNVQKEENIVSIEQEDTKNSDNNIKEEKKEVNQTTVKPKVYTTKSGDKYSYIGTLKIEKINLDMKIISKTTEDLMRISACKLWGADPNQVGNLCIIGHNWRNTKLFSKVPTLKVGDMLEVIDLNGKKVKYKIYKKYTVLPENTDCLEQNTNGKREVTLITCTNDSKRRYIFHASEV